MSATSLWLVPPSTTGLTPFIARYASRYGTEAFSAHVTLLSDKIVPSIPVEEVLSSIRDAVSSWKSRRHDDKFKIRFLDVRQANMYYQCVLAAVRQDASLLALHEELFKAFGHDPATEQPRYFPHLSLVYGDLSEQRKDEIIRSMHEEGNVVRTKDGVEIEGEDGFEPAEVLLVTTKGPTSGWTVLGMVPL